MNEVIASCASCSVNATTTPFPAASPSALITIGAPFCATYSCASFASVKVLLSAQATPYFCINVFATSLLASNSAPFAFGPTTGIPQFQSCSEIPKASGSSGPTTTKSTFS